MKPPTSEPITAEKAPIHAESIRVKKSQFIVTTTEGGKLKDKLTRAAILRAGGLFRPRPTRPAGDKTGPAGHVGADRRLSGRGGLSRAALKTSKTRSTEIRRPKNIRLPRL